MRKLILPITLLLLLLLSCRTGDVRKEPWQEGMTVVTGLVKVDEKVLSSSPPKSLKALLFFKNTKSNAKLSITAQFRHAEGSFYLFDSSIPAGSYTFCDALLKGERRNFRFNYELTIEEGVVNNLGTITLSEVRDQKTRYDIAITNRGYDEVTEAYSSPKWNRVTFSEGEKVIDWSPLFENLPDKVVHNFDDLEVVISYQAEALVGEPVGFVLSTKGSASTRIEQLDIVPDAKTTLLKNTTSIKKEGTSFESAASLSFKLTPEKAGIYTIDCKIVYREHEYTIPPVAITVKEDNNDDN